MSISLGLFLFGVVLLFAHKIWRKQTLRSYSLPKGPRGLPIVGNNFQIAKNAPHQLSKWAEQYGKLYTIKIGNGIPALVVNDVAAMKQLFGMTESTGKFDSEIFRVLYAGSYGIVHSEGAVWQEQREFVVKKLKSFIGLRKSTYVQSQMLIQVEKLSDWLKQEMKKNGRVVLSETLKERSGNTLWEIATGQQSKDNVHLIENVIDKLQKATDSGLAFFSWIKYLAPELSGYNAYLKACKEIHDYVKMRFALYESTVQGEDTTVKNMITGSIEHMKKMRNEVSSSFYGQTGFDHSVQSVVALLVAGIETTATTLHWLIFYLCTHTQVQDRVQREIDEKIGSDRSPSLRDKECMPYTEAVIFETLRMSSIVPFGLIHRLLDDVTYGEYKLPKDLLLLANIYHVHNDKSIWGDPENFRPERFLENNNKLRNFIVAFQVGKRVCPGEVMTKDVIFLFLTGLIQKFSFSMEDGVNAEMYLKPEVAYILKPDNNLGVKVTTRGRD